MHLFSAFAIDNLSLLVSVVLWGILLLVQFGLKMN